MRGSWGATARQPGETETKEVARIRKEVFHLEIKWAMRRCMPTSDDTHDGYVLSGDKMGFRFPVRPRLRAHILSLCRMSTTYVWHCRVRKIIPREEVDVERSSQAAAETHKPGMNHKFLRVWRGVFTSVCLLVDGIAKNSSEFKNSPTIDFYSLAIMSGRPCAALLPWQCPFAQTNPWRLIYGDFDRWLDKSDGMRKTVSTLNWTASQ